MGEKSGLLKPEILLPFKQGRRTLSTVFIVCLTTQLPEPNPGISLSSAHRSPVPLQHQPTPEARFYRRLSIFGLNTDFVIYTKIKQYKDKIYKKYEKERKG